VSAGVWIVAALTLAGSAFLLLNLIELVMTALCATATATATASNCPRSMRGTVTIGMN
jgi:hypothetical protein